MKLIYGLVLFSSMHSLMLWSGFDSGMHKCAAADRLCKVSEVSMSIKDIASVFGGPSWGIAFFNTLGPSAFKAIEQVCFDLQNARTIMRKHNLVPAQMRASQLNENSHAMQKFVLGCQFLKYFDDGVVANTSTELREENCKYLQSLVAPCSELFCDNRTFKAAAETMVCSLGGSAVTTPLVSGVGPKCATIDTFTKIGQSYVNMKDGLKILGVDFMNLPFKSETFDHTSQINFDLETVQNVLLKLELVDQKVATQLTQNSEEVQKFIFGCEFLRRNPRVMAQNDLILRDTVCQYVESIAAGCAQVYCNPEFLNVQRSITCHKRGIGQINPRGRPYPAYEQFGLAAQLFPEKHTPIGDFTGNNV